MLAKEFSGVKVGDTLYRADVFSWGSYSIYYWKMTVTKITECGLWVLDEYNIDLRYQRWLRSPKSASTSKQEALKRLYHRKKAHVRHALRKYSNALNDLAVVEQACKIEETKPRLLTKGDDNHELPHND